MASSAESLRSLRFGRPPTLTAAQHSAQSHPQQFVKVVQGQGKRISACGMILFGKSKASEPLAKFDRRAQELKGHDFSRAVSRLE